MIEDLLILHEGLRLTPYHCTTGKLTIGIGRNLEDTGITEAEARHLLRNDLQRLRRALPAGFVGWERLGPVRRAVLTDMAYNVGVAGLLGFRKLRTALALRDWPEAARQMLDSRWATQVGERAHRLARMMETDRWPPELERSST